MSERVQYRCECGAEDSDSGNYGPSPLALICWSCGEGRGMKPMEQLQRGIGMLQVVLNRATEE